MTIASPLFSKKKKEQQKIRLFNAYAHIHYHESEWATAVCVNRKLT